jgi:hypothetical protein
MSVVVVSVYFTLVPSVADIICPARALLPFFAIYSTNKASYVDVGIEYNILFSVAKVLV